ncbi:rhodanese-related sulfurtransferase [Pseudalkalibacillus hwajinpoensis]|uniref:tRNA uridine(34) hydroxylase n=1 Tax=Guptibacillus hwajinpoensis TaxID=208199 RepID=A0A4U1MLK0_9BACL|nr:rhodanese-related sulfurtransferase [Pseudalkalibacillus hwajinpoensis]TKD71526.1 rhodanese-related sulfurtransferase [Pseudalkalibacillus hwajinpoensis]
MDKDYRVLLFYKYVQIDQAEEYVEEHLAFCKENNLKGRILISEEGINGTLSGTIEDTQKYMDMMHADERFADLFFKIDEATEHPFKKMHVRYRDELVTLRLEDNHNPNEVGGKHLKPAEWREAMLQEDVIILDTRNDYEYDLGHFRGAIRPDIQNFRDLPEWVQENLADQKEKKILTYCTGGIRCEKFTGWMMNQGFQDVNQLDGGIVSYGKDEETQGELWDGQCYVFDGRISVPINQKDHVVVGKDYFTGEPCERYVNCGNPECNKQIITSEENEHKYLRGCTHECRTSPRNRYVAEHGLTQEEVDERIQNLMQEHIEQEV